MNKNNMLRNHSSAVNVSSLKNSMIGKRVLVIDKVMPIISYDVLRPFFDICIAVDGLAATWSKYPDIYISTRTDPHKKGILDMSQYTLFDHTIMCVTQSELDVIKKISKHHSSYVLSWHPVPAEVSAEFSVQTAIPYGLNVQNPGVHLARAAGATDIYASSVYGPDFNDALQLLISEKSGYIPKNILRPIRPQFIDEVRFS